MFVYTAISNIIHQYVSQMERQTSYSLIAQQYIIEKPKLETLPTKTDYQVYFTY